MTVRTTMASLIARTITLLGGDTTFTDQDVQDMLDRHLLRLDDPLLPRAPFYTEHEAQYGDLEDGAVVYYGYNTRLTLTDDYTIDAQRGIVTTPAADYRGLKIVANSYDLYAAAADGWELIAARVWDQTDFSSHRDAVSLSQQHAHAMRQAERMRRQMRTVSAFVERGDTVGATDLLQPLSHYRRSDIPS